jgi:ATP-binding cassette, subfamily B, bacterial
MAGTETPLATPRLFASIRTAFVFVWHAGRRDFMISVMAELVGAAGLAGVLLFGREIATALTSQPPIAALGEVLWVTVGLGASLVVTGVSAVFVRRFRWLVAENVTRHVETEIVSVTSTVDYELYEQQWFHDQLTRSNNDAAESSYQMAYDVLGLINLAATSAVVVAVLVQSVPEVLGVLLLIALPSVIAARASARLAYQTTYQLTTDDRLRYYLYQALSEKSEARELRVFGLRPHLRKRWDRLYDHRMERVRSLVHKQVLFDGIATLMAAVLVAGVLLVLVDAAVDGRISFGDAIVAIVAMQQLSTRLRSAAGSSGSLRQSSFFLTEFDQFRRLMPEATDDPAPVNPTRQRLAVEHVSFRYPGTDTLVLDDVSLVLEPGEVVALVGVSGSGKTTLAHLVAGLYRPSKGRITYGGVDISTIPRDQYWRTLAAVFQDFVRYELTARENIAMSDTARLDDLVAAVEAARRAGIDQALEALTDGYETMMSRTYDNGADLSVGQWQRVAVARAFFRQAPLLILDEPAASLDAVAEQALFERLVELCDARSVLLISHRFSTVRMADRICVMESGRIIEQGTHDQLMALAGRYAELFNLQARSYLTPADGS